jgi:hypothetical protein
VRNPVIIVLVSVAAIGAAPAFDDYTAAKQKFDLIESDRLKPGARVALTARELSAYAAHEAPAGVRNLRLQVVAAGTATGTALVDFGKVRKSQGYHPGWLMSKLLDGERPVSVTARIRSANGQATVEVQRVEISGITVDGGTLDFLIQNFLNPMYPDAAVNRPFELGHRIDRVDLQPGAVNVVIGR